MNQLLVGGRKNKKYKREPLATRDNLRDYIRRAFIVAKPAPGLSEFCYRKYAKVAENDLENLGKCLEGAPDRKHQAATSKRSGSNEEASQLEYPPRIHQEPFYYKRIGQLTSHELRLWTFLDTSVQRRLPISKESKDWHEEVLHRNADLPLQIHYFLEDTFIRPERLKFNSFVAGEISKAIKAKQPGINTVELTFPERAAPINQATLPDYRPIPTTLKGKPITPQFLHYYLQKRIAEWEGFGAIEDQWRRHNYWYHCTQQGEPRYQNNWLLNPFFFDIWKHLHNFRAEHKRTEEAHQVLRKAHFTWKNQGKYVEQEILQELLTLPDLDVGSFSNYSGTLTLAGLDESSWFVSG